MSRLFRVATAVAAAALSMSVADAHASGVIVQFTPGATSAQQSSLLGVSRVTGTVYGTTAKVISVPGTTTARRVAALLNRSRLVQYAEVDAKLHATAVPNDPQFGGLYGLSRIQAPAAWDALQLGGFPAPTATAVKVGIVDTGIRSTHQDLLGKVAACATYTQPFLGLLGGNKLQAGTCADGNGHGTHVAGTIAANANNGIGVAGVAFNAKLVICKGLGDGGSGATSAISSCIRWVADQGAKVVSMSLGGGGATTMQQAVQYAAGKDAIVIAAAGNDGNSTVSYPAGYPEVVSVAATDGADAHAAFSNVNADVEIAAPGVNILSTWGTGDSAYKTISGTSMATPHVAGVAALLRARFPTASAATIRGELDRAVDDLGTAGRDSTFGFGRVNAHAAATEAP